MPPDIREVRTGLKALPGVGQAGKAPRALNAYHRQAKGPSKTRHLAAVGDAPVLYLAHSQRTWGTDQGVEQYEAAFELFPHAEIHSSEFQSYRSWVLLRPLISGLVVIPEEDGSVGRRSFIEVTDCLRLNTPVAVLGDDLVLRRLKGLVLPPDATIGRTAVLQAGRAVRRETFLDRSQCWAGAAAPGKAS